MTTSPPTDPPLRPVPPGRYRDFLPAGEGGMGIVYWALDTELNRQVAFKVMRPDPGAGGAAGVTPPAPLQLASPPPGADPAFEALKARFLQEAWVTGGLEHPGIVPVYELGRTAHGVPYYTMRFVRGGRTLADAIRGAHARGPGEALTLLEPFLRLCDTLAYAHARGVLHRDVKPQNVALGEYGEVVLLDWGLARLTGAPGPGASLWQSQVADQREVSGLSTSASAVGTPGYMPPEALLPELGPLDARGDVFSLGVTLYELLTGALPFPCRTLEEYGRAVALGPAPDPRTRAPHVPAALADACARALAPRPDQRLASAEALAAALRAYEAQARTEQETSGWLAEARAALAAADRAAGAERLRQLDAASAALTRVEARLPGDAGAAALRDHVERGREAALEERVRLERRRGLRRAALAVGAVLLVGAGATALLLEGRRREAVAARAQADAARRRAEDVVGFLLGDLLEGLQPLGRQDLLAQVAERTRAYYDALPPEELSETDQERRATALLNLGDVLRARGDLPGAESAYRRALEGLADPADARGAARLRRAELEGRLARALHERGERTTAHALYQRHVEGVEALARERPDDPRVLDLLAEAHAGLAEARLRQDDEAGARRHTQLAAEAAARAATLGPADATRGDRAVRHRLEWARWIEEPAAAVAEAEAALGEARRLLGADAGDTRRQDLVAESLGRLVVLRGRARDAAGCAAAYEEARALRERLCVLDPGHLRWAEALVELDLRRGDALLMPLNDPPAAGPLLERAYAGATALARRDLRNAVWQHLVVDVCDRLGQRAERLNDLPLAGRWRREGALAARALAERDPQNPVWRYILGHSLCVLGHVVRRTGDLGAATAALTEGLPLVVATLEAAPDRAWFAASWAESLALAHEEAGRREAALAAWRESLALTRRTLALPALYPTAPVLLAARLERLANALEAGSPALGAPEARRALEEAQALWTAWARAHPEDAAVAAAVERVGARLKAPPR